MTATIGKNDRGAWCVYIDGALVSDHTSRAAAATAARQHPVGRVAPGGFVHEPWCEADHLGWTCEAWKDSKP